MSQTVQRLPLGQIVGTPGALQAIAEAAQVPHVFLQRHAQGDWGEVCPEDWRLNDEAVQQGERVLSAYRTAGDIKLWIITEADRSSTTILLPEEY